MRLATVASHDAFIQLTAMATSNGLQKSHCPGHVHINPKLVVATVYLANEETGDKEIHYSTRSPREGLALAPE